MRRLLVAHASRHGSTEEVARAIAARLRERGLNVDLLSASAAGVAGTDGYDGVILGGSLYMGRWNADARGFLRRHRQSVGHLPLAVFALGPRTLSDEDVAASRKQLDGALEKLGVEPQLVAVFGGAVDPAKLPFPMSRMQASDARDWEAIAAWADEAAELFGSHAPLVGGAARG